MLILSVNTNKYNSRIFYSGRPFYRGPEPLPSVITQIVKVNPSSEVMLGDVLYLSSNACYTSDSYGVRPYFLQKSNLKFSAKVVEPWKKMLNDFMNDTQQWLENNQLRSIPETANFTIKRIMPFKIRKRLPHRKRMEKYLED